MSAAWPAVCLAALTVAGAAAETDTFNYRVGTQSIGPKYRFTAQSVVVESAAAIRAMGSNLLKLTIGRDFARYLGVPANARIHDLTELVRDEPSFRAVFDQPFGHYLLWTHPFAGARWQDGLSPAEAAAEYAELTAFARYLLTTYRGTGKRFLLGHWEGDWYLHPGYNRQAEPSPVALQGMIDWLNNRQRAIEDARRAVPPDGVEVYGYTEVNLVRKGMTGGTCLTTHVLPHTTVDFVSYSSYDSLQGEGEALRRSLTEALEFIASKLPPKPGLAGQRVFIGEYGFPAAAVGPEVQARRSRDVMRAAIEWGCPYVLYWELYCNEIKDGRHRGFWLIDEHGVKQPSYTLHADFLRQARALVARFREEHGRWPTDAEYGPLAAALLR